MSITSRGDSYQVTVTHKGERYRRQFTALPPAQVWELEAKAALLRGEIPSLGEQATQSAAGKPRTMRELSDYVAARYWASQKAADKTLLNAEAVVRHFGATTPIAKIDNFAIDKFVIALTKAGNAPATINRKMSALSRMLNVAVGLDIIPKRPFMERLKETERRSFRFTAAIEKQALAYFGRLGWNDMADYVVVSVDTGLRQGEVLRLLRGDVYDNGLRVCTTKSGQPRMVPLTERAQAIFDRRMDALVFPDLTKRQITYHWNRMKEALGLANEAAFVPHILRHEFCSRLADRGVNASAIQRLAGHSSLVVTQRYVNLSPYALQDAIKTLENA